MNITRLCTNYKNLQSKGQYVKSRYLLSVIKSRYSDSQYLYYNGGEGMEWAIFNNQVSDSYDDAVKELSSSEDVAYDAIVKDYNNYYYVIDMSEVIASIQHDVSYYSPVK